MDEKDAQDKYNRGSMNNNDFLINKPLLREINTKLKVSTYGGDSEGVKSVFERWDGHRQW